MWLLHLKIVIFRRHEVSPLLLRLLRSRIVYSSFSFFLVSLEYLELDFDWVLKVSGES